MSDSTLRDVKWEPIEEERLKEPKEGWMLGESKKRSTQISSWILIVRLFLRSRVALMKARSNPSEAQHKFISSVISTRRGRRRMRELVVKYKAEKVCHEEMAKMPLVDLKVLEDESFRMCIDYRELSKIDLYSGCHQMRVHEDEIIKTAFRMHYGRYEFTAMPFWVDQCTNDFHRRNESGGARVAFEDEFGAAEETEVSCEAQQGYAPRRREKMIAYTMRQLKIHVENDTTHVMDLGVWFYLRMLEALGVRDEECDLDGSQASTTHFQSEGLNMRQRR
nr:putative reverse transcriptase domain, ribonuclease H-like domain, aspartic peptidase domain protein [Tanacetum cinerariifolium]